MYNKKLEYLRDVYKGKLLISGISTTAIGHLPVGSPCIGIIDSPGCFKKVRYGNITQFSLEGMAEVIKKGDETEIRSTINDQMASIMVLFLFNIGDDSIDLTTASIKINHFHYIHKLPLIYDTPYLPEWDAPYIIENAEKLPTLIKDQLKSNRFVNYTFSDIKKSNVSSIESNLKAVIKAISKEYPIRTSYHKYRTSNRVLLDTMSISFYNLVDVIPIFDCKKADGMAIDIMLTNSEVATNGIMLEGYNLLFRFIFGKYRENLFTLDGEAIYRPYNQQVNGTIGNVCELLKSQCPRDKKSNKKAKKVS